ncbi:hypothetical protein TNCV_3959421 [Trichonephila clavipes]|uniref:Uncharacterized protein n=1 Tax=Trichonephila clavipes TaxID=2585209 RepID=A0A8X6RHZ8_TRICX|nr:hypothetical protein TNCV_3959421 [Trichonephila clavipes]
MPIPLGYRGHSIDRTPGSNSDFAVTPANPNNHRKRKLDLTGASEVNRLYPNSRRESIKEDKYLNTLPGGEDGGRSGLTKTKQNWDEKMDRDCKAKLAAGTVGFEAGVSLFTDPISDVVKCI